MDPTLKISVTALLKDAMPTLPRGLRKAAKYVIDHPLDFGLDPIRKTATKAEVSTHTLIRMAEWLGFERYDELRAPFRHALVASAGVGERRGWVDALRGKGDLGTVQANAVENELSIVHRSLERQSLAQMERVVAMLVDAPTVYLTAVRASHALAFYLHYVGRMALPSLQLIPRHMTSAIDDLHTANAGDVMIAITFTPYSRETIEACAFARRKGMKLILISDSEIVSPKFSADETLIASVVSTHHFGCYAGAMALIETLIAMLVAHGSTDAQTRIASYETMRKDSLAYWVAKPKRQF